MADSSSRGSWVRWLYNHNPFYVISTMLMLYAVRASYGTLEIGSINCWVMMGVLAGYTVLLAVIGVLIVRWGKVWEDARSILLLLLLLFLAVSISADDLFVKLTSPMAGWSLLVVGFSFCLLVTAGVFWGARIRWGWRYFVPYVLFLALFYVTPWLCSPELNPRPTRELNWMVFLFPQAAAAIGLTLLPAARRGSRGLEDNGTPWRWPWFPWPAFVMIATAVVFRSFALAMTFSQTGEIWKDIKHRSGIEFDTIWGPYFLMPFAAVVVLLVFESALASGRVTTASKILKVAPLLFLLSWRWSDGKAFESFLQRVTVTIGSPLWLTTWFLLLLYGWGVLRRVPAARVGFVSIIGLFSVVQADTLGWQTLSAPQSEPLFLAGGLAFVAAVWKRSSAGCFAAAMVLIFAIGQVLPEVSMIRRFRLTVCYHLTLLNCMACGLLFADRFARELRMIGATWLPLTALLAVGTDGMGNIPGVWRLTYIAGLSVTAFGCAKLFRDRWYFVSSMAINTVFVYGVTVFGFRAAALAIGRAAMTSLCWSVSALLVGVLISAHKAHWLPKSFWPPEPSDPQPALSMAGPIGDDIPPPHSPDTT